MVRQEGLRWSGPLDAKKRQDLDTRMIEELISIENEGNLSPKSLSKKYTTNEEERQDKSRDEKWKKKDFARKEDWEIFAENIDRKHVSFL